MVTLSRRSLRIPGMAAVALALLLAGCGTEPVATPVRPALVVQASAGGTGVEAYAGEVRAREEPQLAFRLGGKIARRHVDAGARVKAGQALAELDPADVRLQSEADRAALAAAEADLALARAEAERYRNLVERQLVSRSLYDARVSQLSAAQSRVRQARSGAAASSNQVGYAVLRAPADGVITQRLAEAGQVVAAGQPVYVMAVDGGREVLISVPENQLSRFPVGRALAVELWSAPGRRLAGTLREIAPAADPLTRTFAARVALEPGAVTAEIGQSARVYAPVEGAAGLRVPLSALTQSRGRKAVWVLDPASSRVRLTPVQTGAYGEDGVPVLSGLKPDDWIVAAGVHLLREGEQVRPVDRDNRPVRLRAVAAAR